MSISDALKKYIGLGILVLMCGFIASTIILAKCNASYKKKIKVQTSKITQLKETIKFRERIAHHDENIERQTQKKINKIDNTGDAGIVALLNSLYKGELQAGNNTNAAEASTSSR